MLIRIIFLKILAIIPESLAVESVLVFRYASLSTKKNSGKSKWHTQRCYAKHVFWKFSKCSVKMSAIESAFSNSAQKMKFSIKDFFSKCGQIRSFLYFSYIYWRNPWWKTSFFVQCKHPPQLLSSNFFSIFLERLFYREPFEQIVRVNLSMATVERNNYCRREFIFCGRKHWWYFLRSIRKQANYTEILDKQRFRKWTNFTSVALSLIAVPFADLTV